MPDRLLDASVVEAARRLSGRTELRLVAADEHAVDLLEVAVHENTRLAVGLQAQVAALEASLVPLLESLEGDAGDDA
ncbi:hypothetical protein [Nocardioides rubriscoriae]|uniref:hypothetical protein n=1 Tax=Nocardioides rubriscoriae TaxID=642762 RepID=UPI0014786E18|nr:hypothetical protein [Nocardioides rubriscoriae]